MGGPNIQAGPTKDIIKVPSLGPCVDLEWPPHPSLHDSFIAQWKWMMRMGDAY